MDLCNPNAAEIILTFAIGGITIRGLIALLKKQFDAKGFLALVIALLCSAFGAAAYIVIKDIVIAHGVWTWMCFLWYTAEVFAGTQVVYQATKG